MTEQTPMDAATLEALKGSIRKWGSIVANGRYAPCPLCDLFNDSIESGPEDCAGCPVFAATGQQYCRGTPYADWLRDKSKESAQAELDFLKSLLPVQS